MIRVGAPKWNDLKMPWHPASYHTATNVFAILQFSQRNNKAIVQNAILCFPKTCSKEKSEPHASIQKGQPKW